MQLVDGGQVELSVDLNSATLTETNTIDVQDVDRISITGTAATWTTAIVTMKRAVSSRRDASSSDGGFVALSPSLTFEATATTHWDVDVSMAGAINLDVTTAEGGASTADFEVYGNRDRDRAPPWAEYFIANVSTTDLNQTAKTQFDYDSITYEDSDYFSLNTSTGEVTIYKAGWYDLYANCAFNNAVVRSSVRSQFFTGGGAVSLTSQCAGSYIRATVGHNEASSSMQYRYLFAEGTTVGTWGTRAAAAGVISPWNSFCNFRLQWIQYG